MKAIGYWSVVSIGIGSMVGGGIFAVLGLAVQMAEGSVPLAFFISGLIAMLTAEDKSCRSIIQAQLRRKV